MTVPDDPVKRRELLRSLRDEKRRAWELARMGFGIKDLVSAGYLADELVLVFGEEAVARAGFTAKALHRANIEAGYLLDAGYTPQELIDGGYTVQNLSDAGFTIRKW